MKKLNIFVTILIFTIIFFVVQYNEITVYIWKYKKEEKDSADVCVLPKYDSWDPEILQYIDLRAGEARCRTDLKVLTKLIDGQIEVLREGYFCHGRCHSRKTDYKNAVGYWMEANHTFTCEFVEVQCRKENSEEGKMTSVFDYGFMHTQIPPKESSAPPKRKKYNVFVILIDSMGSSQADRNIPKTLHYMKTSMKAVNFRYLNKVGVNSYPNVLSLWLGKQMEPVDRAVFGLPSTPEDISWDDACYRFWDNDTVIFDEFKEQGYKTFWADDWGKTAINHPDCYGFQRQIADHTMQPYFVAIEKYWNLKKTYGWNSCILLHKRILKYQNQFIGAYKEHPKFSWIWSNWMSHDFASLSMKMDTDLIEFFIKNKETMDNSFVFLMGDHGFRFGKIVQTKLGALDNNNPLLTISLPKDMRDSKIQKQMELNSQQLQTHYDTRATLLDIARYQSLSNFTDTSNMSIPNERGQSLLRRQIGERSCRTLPIPFEYCICEQKTVEMPRNSETSMDMGRTVVSYINKLIEEKNIGDRCHFWKFLEVLQISAYLPEEKMRTYRIVAKAESFNRTGEFTTLLHVSKTGATKLGRVDRADSYGNRGECVSYMLERFCDCKGPINSHTTHN